MHHESHSAIIALLRKNTESIQSKHKKASKRKQSVKASTNGNKSSNARTSTTLPKQGKGE